MRMNYDYLPRTDDQLVIWFSNFQANLSTMGASLGVSAAEITATTADATSTRTLVTDVLSRCAAAQAATATKRTGLKAIRQRVRALVRRIKANAAYTLAAGQQLGIVQLDTMTMSSAVLSTADEQPMLNLRRVQNGRVEIGYVKHGWTGIQLLCRRGDQADFVPLKVALGSRVIDDRPNLGAAPETREYIAQYLDGDELAGAPGQPLRVTVPRV
jgi:hypothetical protein